MSENASQGGSSRRSPLLSLIDQIMTFQKAISRYLHIESNKDRVEADAAWHGLTEPFWQKPWIS